MRNLVIVGADHLGHIEKNLNQMGFKNILHIKGRKESESRFQLPQEADAVLVLLDFVSHNLAKATKDKARKQSLPICFAKRSWTSIYHSLKSIF